MNEKLIAEIKQQIEICKDYERNAEIAIAVASERKKQYAEMLNRLEYLLGVAKKGAEEGKQDG